jgi:hypothetical protein
LANDLTVQVRASRRDYRYQQAIELDVSVKNESSKSVLLITPDRFHESGPPYVWKLGAHRVGVMLAEDALPPGFAYYGYNPPALRSSPAGGTRTMRLAVGMPPHKGRIQGNDYVWAETPVTGNVAIEVTVGYLRKKFVPLTLAPWAEFLALQEKTRPVRTTVHVAPN